MLKKLAVICFLILSTPAFAANSPISGNVQAKCSIWTETQGVYGNPLPNKLDTLPASGGTKASIRVDIAQANFYKTRFTHPISFSSSNVTTFDMTLAGSTWFTVSSTALYGYNKSFPAGSYVAQIVAECIAK